MSYNNNCYYNNILYTIFLGFETTIFLLVKFNKSQVPIYMSMVIAYYSNSLKYIFKRIFTWTSV